MNNIVGDAAVLSGAVARNFREGRSIVGAVICGNPIQNQNQDPSEESEPINNVQPEPIFNVGPSLVEQQVNGCRRSLLLTMLGF